MSPRPFGFDDDGVTHRADEVAVIREAVDRFLGGASLRTVAGWLDEAGWRTPDGRPWRTPVLRKVLTAPRIAGLSERGGVVDGPAAWEPVITADKRDRVLARLLAGAAPTADDEEHLLSGLVRCGRCRRALVSSARAQERHYVCPAAAGGCGSTTVAAGVLEPFVVEQVRVRRGPEADVRASLRQVTVAPAGPGAHTFDRGRVRLELR